MKNKHTPVLALLAAATCISSCNSKQDSPRSGQSGSEHAAGSDTSAPTLNGSARFEPAFGTDGLNAFEWPVWFGAVPGKPDHYAVVERGNGKTDAYIWTLFPKAGTYARKVFLSQPVKTAAVGKDERGLLSMAFHPRFAENRKYYLYYVRKEPLEKKGDSIVVEERLADSTLLGDAGAPGRRILTLATPYWNHKGSTLLFGPDGFLYVGFGDGGDGGDPQGNGQNLDTWLAKILRIDVDSDKRPYGIPAGNPFFGGKGPDGRPARPEIWAYGLRNPWRSSFDPKTGNLWVGDVGQDKLDEIDIVKAGDNMGWNRMEGSECFHPEAGCDTSGLKLPVAELSRDESIALVGGFVYRGDPASPFFGAYLFGDFETRNFYALKPGHRLNERPIRLGIMPDNASSFGLDANGEPYLVGYNKGRIYRIILPSEAQAQPRAASPRSFARGRT